MNYAHKCLTRKKFMNTNTQIHVEYLGEYVFKSIMLELAVMNKRGNEERARRWRGDTLVLNKWK